GRTYSSVYSSATGTITETSPEGRQSITVVNNQGRLQSEQTANLAPVNVSYDAQHRVSGAAQSAPGGGSESIAYDSQGNIATVTNAMSQAVQFGYDPAARVTTETLADGRAIGITYDANGNVASITPPGRSPYQFTYTTTGQVATYSIPGG